MSFKAIAGIIGLGSFIAFLAPPLIKLQKLPLILIALLAVGMAVYEYVETLRNKD